MTDASSGPASPYGTELRLKRTIPYVGLGLAAVFAAATVALTVTEVGDMSRPAQLGVATAVLLVLVVVPAVGSGVLLRRRVFVGHDGVHVTAGKELLMTLRWADLEQVRASWVSPWTSWRWFQQPQVLLVGSPSAGRRAGKASRLLVGQRMHAGFDVLLVALRAEVRRRPEVVPTEHHREVFDEFAWLYLEQKALPDASS